jgi:hypothetical protein
MAKWKTNEEGQIIGEDGEPLRIGEDVITLADIEGVKTQKDIDDTVEKRLARQKERITTLEAQANKTPDLEKMLADLKAEKSILEAQVAEVKEQAKEESRAQTEKLKGERDRYKAELEAERQARVRDQAENLILGAAKDQFNNPKLDVVPHLVAVHKREPKKGSDGKDTGEFVDLFKVRVKKDEDSDPVDEWLPVEKALEHWAAANPHHVRPTGNSGSGGGQYTAGGPVNPWMKATWNVTKQQEIMAREPGKARSLMQAAGVPVPVTLG